MVAGNSGTCKRHYVGAAQQFVERHGLRAHCLRGLRIGRRRIVVADAAAGLGKGLRHRNADHAKADHADQQPLDAGQIGRHQLGAESGVVAALDLGVGPGEAPQQHRSRRYRVFGKGAVAAAGDIGDRDAGLGERGLVEAVEPGAGDLHQLERGAFEQRRRELRSDCRNNQCLRLAHQLGNRGVVRCVVTHRQRGRRQRADAGEIRLRAQAQHVAHSKLANSVVPADTSAVGKKHRSTSGSVAGVERHVLFAGRHQ